MELLKLAVPCLFGLEGLVGDEIRRLGLSQVRVDNGRVTCRGTAADLARLNLNLRCGERVQLVLGAFTARDFQQLFEGVSAIPWEDWIPLEGHFQVKGYCRDSKLHSVPACQAVVEKAAASRLGGKYGVRTLSKSGERYQIQFSLVQDEAVISLDTSGDGLHKRGYRAVGVEAPLRETLAAAMVILSRYRGKDPFRDPFCGSGTIPIEAALIARNRAPGLLRRFDAQRWPAVPARAWMEAAEEAQDREFRGSYDIWGGDIDPKAVAIARDNARKAEVDDILRLEQADVRSLRCQGEYGQLVTNPPYGQRLMDEESVRSLCRDFGRVYRQIPPKWRVLVLSSREDFEKDFGRRADKKRKLYNGMLRCELYQFQRG